MKKVTKHVYETSDGRPFDIKEEAEKHQGRLDLAEFFDEVPCEEGFSHGENAADAIVENLDRFAEIIRPLIRKPRKGKAEAQADDYEAQLGRATEAATKKKDKAA